MRSVILSMFSILLLLAACEKPLPQASSELVRLSLDAADRGEWKEAESLSYQAVKRNPDDANAYVALALALEQGGRLDMAINQLNKAVKLDAEHFAAQYNRGRILFESSRLEDCPAALEKAVALRPENADACLLLARTYAALGHNKAAIRYFVQLAKMPEYRDKPEPYNELAAIFNRLGDHSRAAKSLTQAYRRAPKNPIIIYNLAVLCDSKLGKKREALGLYRRYLSMIHANPEMENRRRQIIERIRELSTN